MARYVIRITYDDIWPRGQPLWNPEKKGGSCNAETDNDISYQ